MLDKKLKPWLVEVPFSFRISVKNGSFQVNHSPSFHTDAKLDKEIKEGLIFDTMNIVNFRECDRRKWLAEERRKATERLFQRHVTKKADK